MTNKLVRAVFSLCLLTLGASLTGCVFRAVHSVMAPAMTDFADASMTPERAGITTSSWRGKSCKDLEFSYNYMAQEQQQKAAVGDARTAKLNGWQLDAIQQVRNEQGCFSSGGEAAVPVRQKFVGYGYCSAMAGSHLYVTPMFIYDDYLADRGLAETTAFREMLKANYQVVDSHGACAMEDTAAKARAAIERTASLTNLQLSLDTVRVAWTPPPIEKAAKVSAAPLPVASTTDSSSGSMDMGLTLESPSADLVSALGLKSSAGAWVVSVAPGSAAAKAGVKPMDVILDLSGQVVSAPSDVMTIAGKLRPGYKAPLSVWRNHANHELVLAIPEGLNALVANDKSVAIAPAVPASVVTEAPRVQQSANTPGAYCTAQLFTQDAYGSTVSPAKLIAGAAGDIQPSLMGYIAHVKQTQPGVWGDFRLNAVACAPGAVICVADALGPTGKIQKAVEFCYPTQAKADALLKEMREADPQAVMVDWP